MSSGPVGLLNWAFVGVDAALIESPRGVCESLNSKLDTKRLTDTFTNTQQQVKCQHRALRGRYRHTQGYLLRRRRGKCVKKLS